MTFLLELRNKYNSVLYEFKKFTVRRTKEKSPKKKKKFLESLGSEKVLWDNIIETSFFVLYSLISLRSIHRSPGNNLYNT